MCPSAAGRAAVELEGQRFWKGFLSAAAEQLRGVLTKVAADGVWLKQLVTAVAKEDEWVHILSVLLEYGVLRLRCKG